MTLRLHHYTGYSYRGGASASYNEARMQPQTNPDQTVLHTKVEVTPNPWSMDWLDYWGTSVTSFEVHERHPELTVEATSTVTVDRRPVDGDGLSWEGVYDEHIRDVWLEVMGVYPRVEPGPELRAILQVERDRAATPAQFVAAVARVLADRVAVLPDRTRVHAKAQEAWARGEGSAQDLAHLTIGALRAFRIPARYVAGYLLPDPDPAVGRSYIGAAHAWVQWWDGAWVPLDTATTEPPDDRYVEVGVGRDYKDVVPLAGIFTGSPGSTMFTRVEITRLS